MLRFVVLVLALAALGLTVASLAFPKEGYYQVTTTSSNGGSKVAIGLMRTCSTTTIGGTTTEECDWRSGDRFTTTTATGSCSRDTANSAARLYGAEALVLLGGLLALIAAALQWASLLVQRALPRS